MSEQRERQGLLMVYTGDGKGKTTAAVGQAVRALGHGYRVFMLHFMKGRDYGEFLAARNIPGLTIVKAGRDEFVKRGDPEPLDVEMARKALKMAREAIQNGDYDLVVLDELNVAVNYGLLPLEEVLDILRNRPAGVDIILTGREAAPEIMALADLVSEVKEIKHHYASGVQSRKGIEY